MAEREYGRFGMRPFRFRDAGDVPNAPAVILRESGGSSTPRPLPLGSNERRGVLDRPVKPGDDTGVGAKLVAGLVENARM